MKRSTLALVLVIFGLAAYADYHSAHEPDHPSKLTETVAAAPAAPQPVFTLLNEKVYDAPIKTQLIQNYVVTPLPTPDQLRAKLKQAAAAAEARSGFQYHASLTNIFIYIYANRQQAEAGRGLWLAMYDKTPGDPGSISVDTDRVTVLAQPETTRFGLTEDQRKKVFYETTTAEDRADREAEAKYPDSTLTDAKNVERLAGYQNSLTEKYRAKVAKRYGLTDDQMTAIDLEGVKKGWPEPKL